MTTITEEMARDMSDKELGPYVQAWGGGRLATAFIMSLIHLLSRAFEHVEVTSERHGQMWSITIIDDRVGGTGRFEGMLVVTAPELRLAVYRAIAVLVARGVRRGGGR